MPTHTAPKLIPVPGIARRSGRAVETVVRKLDAAGIEPDAVVELGARDPIPVFAEDRIPALLEVLAGPAPVAA